MVGNLMFRTVGQSETVDWIVRVVAAHEPFVAVTGDVGVGKSTVLDAATARLKASGRATMRVSAPYSGVLELQGLLADKLGAQAGPQTTPAVLASALRERRTPTGQSATTVLLIDDADQLTPTLLSFLRLLHRLANLGSLRLQTVLVGRFTMWERFADAELEELRAAIAARLVVLPLPPDEALGYLKRRLLAAGALAPAEIPRRLAHDAIVLGQGLPGRLDVVASCLVAHDPVGKRVTPQGVRAAAAELGVVRATRHVPARLPGRQSVVGGSVVAVGVTLFLTLPVPPWTARPAALTGVEPTVAYPAWVEPEPARLPVPAKSRRTAVDLSSPPAFVAFQGSGQPGPAWASVASARDPGAGIASSHATTTTATAAPTAVTPTNQTEAVPKPALAYAPPSPPPPPPDAGAQTRAEAVAAALRQRGHLVGESVTATTRVRATTVGYFFLEDRSQAERLARDLGGVVTRDSLAARRGRIAPPPPGTLRVVLARDVASAR